MKKLMSVLLALVLVFSLSTSVFAAEKKVKECQPTGNGTQKKPIIICTPDQLAKAVGDSQLHYYKLGADIDLSAYKMNENSRWTVGAEFGGELNGKGYKILNFTASGALIGKIKENAKIENINMINVLTGGDAYSAMLANTNNGTIENATVSGVTGSRFGTGGLVINNFGKISNCYTEGRVSSQSVAGGLVLNNHQSGSIINSSSKSTVSGSYYGGGLVGSNAGTIQNSFANGNVVSAGFWGGTGEKSGGLASTNSSTGIIKNSYATGNVYTKNMESSNLVGTNSGQVKNSKGTGMVLNFSEYKY